MLLPAITDARIFHVWAFKPMVYSNEVTVGFNFLRSIHAADERIPVEAVDFGSKAIYELLKHYNG